MAFLQVITASKTGSEFVTWEEAEAAYKLAGANSAIVNNIASRLEKKEFVNTTDWDADTQTLVYSRVWTTEAAYNAYVTNQKANRNAFKTNAEAGGWTVTESTSTV